MDVSPKQNVILP